MSDEWRSLGIGVCIVVIVIALFMMPARPRLPHRAKELRAEPPMNDAERLRDMGTPEDAARLMDQGIDLEALGYRPPPER